MYLADWIEHGVWLKPGFTLAVRDGRGQTLLWCLRDGASQRAACTLANRVCCDSLADGLISSVEAATRKVAPNFPAFEELHQKLGCTRRRRFERHSHLLEPVRRATEFQKLSPCTQFTKNRTRHSLFVIFLCNRVPTSSFSYEHLQINDMKYVLTIQ